MNPEQAVLLLRAHFLYIDFVGQPYFAFEWAVIDFHRDHLQSGIFLATWLGHIAHTADRQALSLNREIDIRALDSGKIDTNRDAFFAAIGVDGRPPSVRTGTRKAQPGQLMRHIVDRAVQPAQPDRAS